MDMYAFRSQSQLAVSPLNDDSAHQTNEQDKHIVRPDAFLAYDAQFDDGSIYSSRDQEQDDTNEGRCF